MSYDYDFIVIGGGSAGISAVKTACGFGKKTLLIEHDRLGGECTWSGCIPSKALIRAAHAAWEIRTLGKFQAADNQIEALPSNWDSLKVLDYVRSVQAKVYKEEDPKALAEWGAQLIEGKAKLKSPHSVIVNGKIITARRIVLATGSDNVVPNIPGLSQVPYLTNQTIFLLKKWPKSLAILGAGPIGIEMAQSFQRLGTKVTVLEMADRILPREDAEIVDLLTKSLTSEGIIFVCGAKVTQVLHHQDSIICTYEKDGKTQEVETEQLLLAIGRKARTEDLGLEDLGIKTSHQGIVVNRSMQTSVSSILAAGDCTGIYPLSHSAGLQGVTASLDSILPWPVKADYTHMLWVVFSDPELARIGFTEVEARKKFGQKIQVVKVDLAKLDRAKCDDIKSGFAKWILDKSGRVIGAHILGPRAGELIHETQVIKALRKPLKSLQNVIHAYPTYSEIHKLAGRAAFLDKLLNNRLVKLLRGKK